jgi:parallel beta-helix repeat protein
VNAPDRRTIRSAATICLIVLLAAPLHATIHVTPAGDDANDGLTWPTAKKTVQAGLNAAVAGDQVWVAAGTYFENVWLDDDVQLYGGFAGTENDLIQRDWTANVTILDGDQLDSVIIAYHVGAAARIDGFTIRNGRASAGGGIHCYTTSPTIANNIITANTADMDGGGIFSYYSSPIITGNTITGNAAGSDYSGGGIFCGGSYTAPTITNNTISANTAADGAGIYSTYTSPFVAGNAITGNSAGSLGGGIALHNSAGTVAGNTITANTSTDAGGGIYCYLATSRIADNVITGNNAAGSDGGGICCDFSNLTIAGNTLAGNRASSSGGGIYCLSASPTITHTIVAFNSSGITKYGTPIPTLRYNCVYGNRLTNYSGLGNPTGINENISVDPLFTAASPGGDGFWGTDDDVYGDLHLLDTSPCRNTGDPAFVPISGETDVDGQNRVMADRVDIGADEFTWTGDANQDGYVDVVDLLGVVYAFGTHVGDPNYDARCDFNLDGAVDVVDLLDVAYNFGK